MSGAGDKLRRAWLALIGLSVATTMLAELVGTGADLRLTGTLVLALAFFKARVILGRYLRLADAPSWRAGFDICLSLFCLVLLGLYLLPLVL